MFQTSFPYPSLAELDDDVVHVKVDFVVPGGDGEARPVVHDEATVQLVARGDVDLVAVSVVGDEVHAEHGALERRRPRAVGADHLDADGCLAYALRPALSAVVAAAPREERAAAVLACVVAPVLVEPEAESERAVIREGVGPTHLLAQWQRRNAVVAREFAGNAVDGVRPVVAVRCPSMDAETAHGGHGLATAQRPLGLAEEAVHLVVVDAAIEQPEVGNVPDKRA